MIFAIRFETVYGRTVAYPVSATAMAIADIEGTKTITAKALRICKERLGAEIVVVEGGASKLAAYLNRDGRG